MRRSEIFDNFVKIAEEKGLVSKDAPEKAKKILEETRRADSQTIKDIEVLYGVKPDAPKDMEYKRNIIEDAHPEPVVISPSYDKLNGLVENNNERQNILINIINKTPNGHLTNHKYAEKDLILSLVRIGNDLDNRNDDELRALADTCLDQLSQKKKLIKEAIAPMAIVALIGAAAASIYAYEHLPNVSVSFRQDNKRLKDLIRELLSSEVSWGLGIEVSSRVKKDLNKLMAWLNKFESIYNGLYPAIISVESGKDAQELMQQDTQAMIQKSLAAANKLRSVLDQFLPIMQQIKKNFSSSEYKFRESEMGMFTEIAEKAHLYGGSTSLFADKFEQIVNQISAYITSVNKSLEVLESADEERITKENNAKAFFAKKMKKPSVPEPSEFSADEDESGIAKTDAAISGLVE